MEFSAPKDHRGVRSMSGTTTPSTPTPPPASATGDKKNATPASDRRKRRRARITAQVHVRGGAGTAQPFEDQGTSVNVSRDGLLFATSRPGYWVGQMLEVIFPYSRESADTSPSQRARVVRVDKTATGSYAIAIHFTPQVADGRSAGQSRAYSATFAGNAITAVMILVVETDPQLVDWMRNLLQQDGYQVASVATPQQALDVLKMATPALVIAQADGSDMNGQDLCLIIKKNDRLKNVPVILLTDSPESPVNSAAMEYGAVVCLAKPFKPERLQNVVRLVAPPPSQRSAYGAKLGYGYQHDL
jgi:CheY-like chemotaxis protein